MQIIENTTEFHISEPTVIAIGKFDGIHRGHQKIFEKLFEAKKQGLKTAVFTFDPSPESFFSKKQQPELTTGAEKRSIFSKMQIDYLVEYPFRQETADVLPQDYVTDFLLNKMSGRKIVAGTDVSFGKGGYGDADLLEKMSKEYDFQFEKVDKIRLGEREISSSYIREEVEKGNMENAEKLLGRPYFLYGTVEDGKKLGRTIGIPTANLYPKKEKLLPPNGVYYSLVLLDKEQYYGVTNIGCRPTLKDGSRMSAETYILDFDRDIYGKDIVVELKHFERAEHKFASVDALTEAIRRDIEETSRYFNERK